MKKIVDWNKVVGDKCIWEWFIELGNLDEIDREIIKYRKDKVFNKNIKMFAIAHKCNVSEETIKKRSQKLIKKYKELMKIYPDIFTLKKEYQNVECIACIIDKQNNYYTVEIQYEDFDTFFDIRNKIIKLIETKYKVCVDNLIPYRVVISGSYNRNRIDI